MTKYKWLQFRIYLSLAITTLLFLSVYVVLFYLGYQWWGKGRIKPGIVFVIIGLIPLIYAIFKSGKERGKIDKSSPLYKTMKDIAKEFNMKVPSKFYILPTTEIFVSGVFKKKAGVGVAALRAITKDELKAILRHEFGHFYGNDTVIGSFLARVQYSLEASSKFGKIALRAAPHAIIALIGLIIMVFAKTYSLIFRIIISIYSRQVEYRADYIAATRSGKEVFGKALLNYSAYITYFEQVGYSTVIHLLQEGKAMINIYDSVYNAYGKLDKKEIKKILFENDKGGLFSSHPKLRKRLRAIGLDPAAIELKNKIDKSAVSLLKDQKKLEKDFTTTITQMFHIKILHADAVARQGRCKHCGKQFQTLGELLKHESNCKKAS